MTTKYNLGHYLHEYVTFIDILKREQSLTSPLKFNVCNQLSVFLVTLILMSCLHGDVNQAAWSNSG